MVAEIFLAFIILFAVLTFVIENITNFRQPLGYETEQLWVAGLVLRDTDSTEVISIKDNLRRELNAHPKVENVSFGSFMSPLGNSQNMYGNDDMSFQVFSHLFDADENFATTAGVEVTQGRWFSDEDAGGKYPPMVISEKLYKDYFEGRPVLDSVISMAGEHKVVGMVKNFNYLGKFAEEVPISFRMVTSDEEEVSSLYIRLREGVGIEFEEELTRLISDVSKLDYVTLEQIEQRVQRDNRVTFVPMIAMISISGFLIINVALGLFGVLWYNISQRRGEIGLRRAIGAYKSHIMIQFVAEILLITFFGMLLALLFCVQVPLMDFTEIKDTYLYQAMTYSFIFITVLVLICALYPSQQAARIAPAEALHAE